MVTTEDFKNFTLCEIKNDHQVKGGAYPSIQNTKEYTVFLGFIIETGSHCDTVND